MKQRHIYHWKTQTKIFYGTIIFQKKGQKSKRKNLPSHIVLSVKKPFGRNYQIILTGSNFFKTVLKSLLVESGKNRITKNLLIFTPRLNRFNLKAVEFPSF